MRLSVIKGFSFFIILCFTSIIYSQNSLTVKKGKVIDSLIVPGANTIFSIYLPKSFDLNKKWPVVFGFDSNGNAGNITRLYREAAEELGYMVVISDFPEKVEIKEKAEYVASFMDHIFSIFPIQKKRVYTTGLGEDANLISLVSVLINDVAGTIAVGDTHYYNSSVKIRKNFSYFGVVNVSSHNYKNFLYNKMYLKKQNAFADVLDYEGKQDFPNPNLFKKILSNFTLQTMSKGVIPKDSIWIQNLFQTELKQVEINQNQGNFLLAYEEIKKIKDKYKLFFDTSYLKKKEKQLKQFKGYEREKKLYVKYDTKEAELRQSYQLSLAEDVGNEVYENLGWWQHEMSKLDELSRSKEKYASNTVLRIKGYLKEKVRNYKAVKFAKEDKFEKTMYLNILSTIIDKKDYESYRTVISLSAQDQDYETALFYLEKLLKNGFKDKKNLYNIEGTLGLRLSKPYNILIEKYLGSSRYLFSY